MGSTFEEFVREIIPFRFLAISDRNVLRNSIAERRFPAGRVIYRSGDNDSDMFLLVEGLVETIDTTTESELRINRIEPGHYFGERAALFGMPREFTLRAVEDSVVFAISGDFFLGLLHSSRAFAQAFGTILREKQGIFDAFDRFSSELSLGISEGSIDIRRLLPFYRLLEPALHPGANAKELDFDALRYAVSRLPANVTRTFVYLLSDELPLEFSDPDKTFRSISTEARRRNIWEMLPGKNMVLLRTRISDLFDFVTCLCVYSVEAVKIRKRMGDSEVLTDLIRRYEGRTPRHEGYVATDTTDDLEGLPFTDEERRGLATVWPDHALEVLRGIAFHREAVHIDVRRQIHTYNSRRTDLWTKQISGATRDLIGCDPGDLPATVRVHVISSNTHSVTNCLNPFYTERMGDILSWSEEVSHPATSGTWVNPMDLCYAAGGDYISSHPEIYSDYSREINAGTVRLVETVSTGIEVQLVDLSRLSGHSIDPALPSTPVDAAGPNGAKDAGTDLLVNIDYAFGEQAEEIIRNLILLFGTRLKSINVLGKAGALIGSRGDILVPTAFIEQSSDNFYPFGERVRCDLSALEALAPGSQVHSGPLLTVSGTLLQNSTMLHFYRHIWDCIGLEMEGSYYYRQILESQQLEVIGGDIPLRFLYYVSDLPLSRAEDLSISLSPVEGIPPLYAITRQILAEIFKQEQAA